MNYIGIDLGTTAVKCGIYEDGRELALYRREYQLIADGDFVEQKAELWWEIIKEGIGYLAKETGIYDIEALSVSSQGISIVPINKEGNPMSNAISWLDTRASEETEYLGKTIGEDVIYATTGKKLISCYTLPKMMWLKKHRPEIVKDAALFLMPLDFVNFKLCGEAVTDYSMASGTMMYDIDRRRWDERFLELAGVSEAQLPKVAKMGTFLGYILPSLAKELNVSPKMKIILGGQDQKLSALGAGIGQGIATLSVGTSSAITFAMGGGEKRDFARFAFDDKDTVYEVALETTGAALKWLKNTMGYDTYAEMDDAAESAGNSGGVFFDPNFSKGGNLCGIKLGVTRGQIVYGLYESIAKEVARCFAHDDGIDEIRIFGGGAKSEIWCRVISEVTGKKVAMLNTNETAALGAVMLASGGRVAPATIVKYI